MRLVRSRKSRLLQTSLLLSVLTSIPAFANPAEEISGTLIAQSGMESSSTSTQTSVGTESAKHETSAGSESPSVTTGRATQTTGTAAQMTSTAAQTTTSTSSTSINPAAGSSNAVTSSVSTTTTSAAGSTDPAPGPLLDSRKLVLSKIQAAKKQGTGISGYMAEYGRIEQMVKNGEPEANYAERLGSLQTGIDDQLKRSQLLKTQRPTYSGISSSSSSSSSGSGGSGGGGGGHHGGGSLGGMSVDQLKAKYGDKVPPDIADKLSSMSPETKQKLLDSDMVKKFLGK